MTTLEKIYEKMSDNLKQNTVVSLIRRGNYLLSAGSDDPIESLGDDETLPYLEKHLNKKQFKRVVLNNNIITIDISKTGILTVYLILDDDLWHQTIELLGAK